MDWFIVKRLFIGVGFIFLEVEMLEGLEEDL